MRQTSWDLAFTAEPKEVAGLRRVMRSHLALWELHEVIDQAQLCVSELVANVITHVGPGTPATLGVSMNGMRLRIEVRDPDTRALPTLLDANMESEGGRGMALIDALAERWGVELGPDRKVTWCELATGLTSPSTPVETSGGRRTEARGTYTDTTQHCLSGVGRDGRVMAEESVITVITDYLHWLRAHGCDVESALDRVQTRYEAELGR
ncbi:ATP-binding protein [Streptomyces sp. SBST2-5]|uniref:ATP-binding protein n=1 Tax=Streptomyces composti TaxID=2720025 RepID=A0ABX1A6N5_9ACTN|nr:ATP-binding protein [Streptomyces composti]NJP50702.1 ATP-binding protein [Streptomyces composti]